MSTENAKNINDELVEFAASFSLDPYGFVLAAYPWGSNQVKDDGPDEWQTEVLKELTAKLKAGQISVFEAIQIAVASGHGIGKSALVAWLIDWAITTMEDTKGVVTANTENQLKTKTWAELAKWHRLSLWKDWFEVTATAIFSTDPEHSKTWRIDMVPWSLKNTEAFAGLHNLGKRIIVIFDEGSGIPDEIWEVTEGALTDADTQIIWIVFGNPTRNIGRFRDCFGRFKKRWSTKQIDSRTSPRTNKKKIQEWVDDYGIDSDFVKVRVLGQFPSSDANALLGPDEVQKAMARHARKEDYDFAAKILGVDVARQGQDRSTICPRQGLVAFRPKVMRIPNIMTIADEVARAWDKWEADACMVDGTGGYGAGVIDRLLQMGYTPLEVQFAGKAPDKRFFNMRAYILWELAAWVKRGGCLPNFPGLELELISQTYRFIRDQFVMEDKDIIRDLIGESPDLQDGYGVTFAYPVQPKQKLLLGVSTGTKGEYDPIARAAELMQKSNRGDYSPFDGRMR